VGLGYKKRGATNRLLVAHFTRLTAMNIRLRLGALQLKIHITVDMDKIFVNTE